MIRYRNVVPQPLSPHAPPPLPIFPHVVVRDESGPRAGAAAGPEGQPELSRQGEAKASKTQAKTDGATKEASERGEGGRGEGGQRQSEGEKGGERGLDCCAVLPLLGCFCRLLYKTESRAQCMKPARRCVGGGLSEIQIT